MRIGIFGGTFDPPHAGHKKYADEVRNKLSLDNLIVIPTAAPPHKQKKTSTTAEDRLNMLGLLFEKDSGVLVSDMEIARGGRSYTFETVTLLREQYPDDELIFILGSDMLLSFHTWKNPDVILEKVKICAVTRDGEIDEKMLGEYAEKHFPGKKERFIICDFEPIEISSTEIREKVKNGLSVDGLVDAQVMEYIKEKELYL
ncbi:MAG: nicotinate-nucleotide adenylyltransferase [Clostridia bacterium]|nr:nicotinate-nucleotide adenylyltransferase [Clostridia bacterium]